MQCEHIKIERQGYMIVEKHKWNVDNLCVVVLQHSQETSEPI
jgi:hypothetical protein